MTHREAKDHGRSPGYAVRVGDECERAYLADYRTCPIRSPYTYRPDHAEYFEFIAEARDRAHQVQFLTGMECAVVTIPPAVSPLTPPAPCRCHATEPAPLLTERDAHREAWEAFASETDADQLAELADALEVVLIDQRRYRLPAGVPRYVS